MILTAAPLRFVLKVFSVLRRERARSRLLGPNCSSESNTRCRVLNSKALSMCFALQHNIICPSVSYICLSTVLATSILKLPHKNTTNFAKIAAKRTQQKNFQQLCGGDGDSKDEKISVAV